MPEIRKFAKIYMTFNTSERLRFNKFIFKNINNNSKLYIPIQVIFDSYIADLGFAEDDKILKNIGKQQSSFSKSQLNAVYSYLYKLFLEFIQGETNEKEGIILLKFYRRKQLHVLYSNLFKKLKKRYTVPNSALAFQKHEALMGISSQYIVTHADKRTDEVGLDTYNKAIEMSYQFSKLKVLSAMLQRQVTTGMEYKELNEPEKIVKQINWHTDNILIRIWLAALQFQIDKKNLVLYRNLKNDLFESYYYLERAERDPLFYILQNGCRDLFDYEDYLKELFDLYNQQINLDEDLKSVEIHTHLFKNIVTVALNLNEIDWLEQFMLKFKGRLIRTREMETIKDLASIKILLKKKELNQARSLIGQLSFKDIYNKLDLKRQELILYYELKEWAYADSLANAFQVYLTRAKGKTISGRYQESNKNFINIYKRMLRQAQRLESNRQQIVINDLDSIKRIAERRWIQSRLKSQS